MKSKISVFFVTAVLLMGIAASAQAISFEDDFFVEFLDPVEFEYEDNELKFIASLNMENGSIGSLPTDWKIEVTFDGDIVEKSEVTGGKLEKKNKIKGPNKIEGSFDTFEMGDTGAYPDAYKFTGILLEDGLTEGTLDPHNPYFFDIFIVFDEYKSAVLKYATLTNIDPNKNDGSAPVPEPATMLLVGAGMLGLAAVRRRQKK